MNAILTQSGLKKALLRREKKSLDIKEETWQELDEKGLKLFNFAWQTKCWMSFLQRNNVLVVGATSEQSNISLRQLINHAEGNSMASLTQMVVDKGILNSLIAEGLLKILRDFSRLPLQKPLSEEVIGESVDSEIMSLSSPHA